MNEQDLLVAVVTEAMGVPAEEAKKELFDDAGKLKDTAKAWVLGIDQKRVAKFKTDWKLDFDNGHKAGTKEALGNFEKTVREKTATKSAKNGIDLILDIISENKQAAKELKDFPEDEIKKHPAFMNLEKSIEEALKAKDTEWQGKLTAAEQRQQMLQNQGVFTEACLGILDAMKPVLPKDAAKAKRQKDMFIRELSDLKYQLGDDKKTIILLKPDGTRLEDAHGRAVDFTAHIKQIADGCFDFEQSEEKGSAGNPDKKGEKGDKKGAAGYTLSKPADERAYMEKVAEINGDASLTLLERVDLKNRLRKLHEGK